MWRNVVAVAGHTIRPDERFGLQNGQQSTKTEQSMYQSTSYCALSIKWFANGKIKITNKMATTTTTK